MYLHMRKFGCKCLAPPMHFTALNNSGSQGYQCNNTERVITSCDAVSRNKQNSHKKESKCTIAV